MINELKSFKKVTTKSVEQIASKYDCIVTCTGGFYVNNITPEQLQEIRLKLDAFL